MRKSLKLLLALVCITLFSGCIIYSLPDPDKTVNMNVGETKKFIVNWRNTIFDNYDIDESCDSESFDYTDFVYSWYINDREVRDDGLASVNKEYDYEPTEAGEYIVKFNVYVIGVDNSWLEPNHQICDDSIETVEWKVLVTGEE